MLLWALGLATLSVASMISLKLWFDMCRAMSNWDVDTWSSCREQSKIVSEAANS